jgi:hypothetical protein
MTKQAHPDSQKHPENRRGTRSFREYSAYQATIGGTQHEPERIAGGLTAMRASPRQMKKALALYESPAPRKAKDIRNGRVLRACYRCIAQNVGEWADSQYFGGA